MDCVSIARLVESVADSLYGYRDLVLVEDARAASVSQEYEDSINSGRLWGTQFMNEANEFQVVISQEYAVARSIVRELLESLNLLTEEAREELNCE